MLDKTNLQKRLKPSLLIASLFVVVVLVTGVGVNKITQNNNHLSWYSWLTGKSVSYDFHYLDLLELLYRRHSSNHSQ